MNYYTPILILLGSNLMYQVCSKSVPAKIDPLAMLVITYILAAVFCVILYTVMGNGGGLLNEYKHLNWAGILMAVTVVGMEVGTIYLYKVGWDISVGVAVSNALIAVGLVLIGAFVYHETITFTKIIGIGACFFGIYLINK